MPFIKISIILNFRLNNMTKLIYGGKCSNKYQYVKGNKVNSN
jgi:hypothetical protein